MREEAEKFHLATLRKYVCAALATLNTHGDTFCLQHPVSRTTVPSFRYYVTEVFGGVLIVLLVTSSLIACVLTVACWERMHRRCTSTADCRL
jgi:hypothetical protein